MLSVIGLVLLAACCHAIWNAYVKVSEDRLAGLVSINLIGAASGLLMIPFVPVPDAATWTLIGLSVVAGEGLPPWRSDASLSRGARRGAAGGLDDRAAGIERTALAGRTGRHGFHLYRHCDNGAERTHVPRLALRSWRSRF